MTLAERLRNLIDPGYPMMHVGAVLYPALPEIADLVEAAELVIASSSPEDTELGAEVNRKFWVRLNDSLDFLRAKLIAEGDE